MARKGLRTMLPIGSLKARRNRGFTLLELVLAVIVILILVNAATPTFRRPFERLQLRRDAQTLAQLMRYVQARAIAERTPHQINFDFSAKAYWASKGEAAIDGRWGKTFKLPPTIKIAGNLDVDRSFITFYPNANVDQAVIALTNEHGESFNVIAQRKIGYVEIK